MRTLITLMLLGTAVASTGRGDDVPAALQQARLAVGGGALEHVRSLAVDFPDAPAGLDIVLPDKFRYRTERISHILDGDSFRQSRSVEGARLETARRMAQFNFALSAIKYLLAVPDVLGITASAAGPRVVEEFGRVVAVHFEGQQGFSYHLFLDPATHVPVGAEWSYPSSGGTMGNATAKFSDYRAVDGVRFPFRTEATYLGRHPVVTEVARIRVNAPELQKVFGTR